LGAACGLQNSSGSPRHLLGASPQEAWEGRDPPEEGMRAAFLSACVEARVLERRRAEEAEEGALDGPTRAKIERAAISRVLCERHYLKIRRA
jgi:hypothetical protein